MNNASNAHRLLAAAPLLVGLAALTGCGMSNPRLVAIKSPEASPCQAADCPTLEIPAPNHDEMFNPAGAAVVTLDGTVLKPPFVFANKGRVWYVTKVNPGPHSVKVEPIAGTNLVGTIASAASTAVKFEAQKGRRYWLWNRIGVGGYSAKTWVEDAAGDRPVVAGERNLEAHNMAAEIFLGDEEKKAQASKVEVWWAGAPTYDRQFQGPGVERVGDPADVAVPPPAAPAAAPRVAGGGAYEVPASRGGAGAVLAGAPPGAALAPTPGTLAAVAAPVPDAPLVMQRRNKAMWISGIALTSVGAATLIAGGALFALNNAASDAAGALGGDSADTGLNPGIPVMIIGGLMAGAGVPLWIIGGQQVPSNVGWSAPTFSFGNKQATVKWSF